MLVGDGEHGFHDAEDAVAGLLELGLRGGGGGVGGGRSGEVEEAGRVDVREELAERLENDCDGFADVDLAGGGGEPTEERRWREGGCGGKCVGKKEG